MRFLFCLIYTESILINIFSSPSDTEWFDKYKDLPKLEEIEAVWDLKPPGDKPDGANIDELADYNTKKIKYARQLEILTWYLDTYLPLAVGLEFWGPNIRPFKLMTDMKVVSGDPSGKKKVLVTITSEAFGLLVYANCRDKWVADFTLKAGNKKAKIPKYDKDKPETHKHQNKWSSSRTGQVQGGGWAPEALEYLNKQIAAIQKWRNEEAERGFVNYNFGKELICQAQQVTMDGQDDKNKKRKRAEEKAVESEAVCVDLTILDE